MTVKKSPLTTAGRTQSILHKVMEVSVKKACRKGRADNIIWQV